MKKAVQVKPIFAQMSQNSNILEPYMKALSEINAHLLKIVLI